MGKKFTPPRFLGELHPQAKLTAVQVVEIRRLIAEGQLSAPKIAALYGVSKSVVYHIRHGETWECVEKENLLPKRSVTRSGINKAAAKLNDAAVRDIRERIRASETISSLSRRFGVSRPVIRSIRDGKAWKHVT